MARPIFTRTFWADAFERAVMTAAQVLVGFLVADVAIVEVDWPVALGVTATATLASVLKSVAASRSGTGSASAMHGV